MSHEEECAPKSGKGDVADVLSGESIRSDGGGTDELAPPIGYEIMDGEVNSTMEQLFRSLGLTFREDDG